MHVGLYKKLQVVYKSLTVCGARKERSKLMSKLTTNNVLPTRRVIKDMNILVDGGMIATTWRNPSRSIKDHAC